MLPQEYANVLKYASSDVKDRIQPFVQGICGRIIRGKKPGDFETLTDDPNRLIVMLMDSDGLASLLGKTPYNMLIKIGYLADYIKDKLAQANQFKLVVFPSEAAHWATWDNVFKVATTVYPDLAPCCQKHNTLMRSLTKWQFKPDSSVGNFLSPFEQLAGYSFSEADKKDDPRFMSLDAYRASSRSVWELRALFYHSLHLRELFSGDGYTYNEQGRKQLKEYLMLNKKIADIPHAEVIDLDI